MARTASGLAVALFVSCLVLRCSADWKPAVHGLQELDTVEQALHKVEDAKLTPEQRKVASRVVQDVERTVALLRADGNLTKVQKKEKLKSAIQELQGLQSQWELAAVELALKKLVENPHLSPKQIAGAKKVVAEVNSVVEQIESGKLTGEAQNKQVAFAIQELSGLQREWAAAAASGLQGQIAAKKALLKETEAELKLATMQKELLEKKLELKALVNEKNQHEAVAKQREEDAAQAAIVSKLVATAKALASTRNSTKGKEAFAALPSKKDAIRGILVDLKARAHNVSEAIKHLDAEEKNREAELSKSVEVPRASAKSKKIALAKGQAVLKVLVKQELRSYKKIRAVRESELQELQESIRSIETGDVSALTRVMSKMQAESKALQAKAKNFLY